MTVYTAVLFIHAIAALVLTACPTIEILFALASLVLGAASAFVALERRTAAPLAISLPADRTVSRH
jgi:hypothetical protein